MSFNSEGSLINENISLSWFELECVFSSEKKGQWDLEETVDIRFSLAELL